MVVEVSVPSLSVVSALSSTYSQSLPLVGSLPLIVNAASMSFTFATLAPTLNVSEPLPPFAVVGPLIASMLMVSSPLLPFTVVVPACVLSIVNVSPPVPRPTFTIANES